MTENQLTYALPENMGIQESEALLEAMLQLRLAQGSKVKLDASKSGNISAACAQIIIALEKTVNANDGTLEISGAKDIFTSSLQDMGFGWLVSANQSSGEA